MGYLLEGGFNRLPLGKETVLTYGQMAAYKQKRVNSVLG